MKIKQNDRKDIITAIQSGQTASELASKYGVSSGRIRVIYKKEAGIQSKPIKRFSETEKETIVAEIQAKKATMTELAGRYGVSIAAIAYTYKSRTGNAVKPQLSQRDKEEIVAALQAKKATIQELAARYGVSAGTIGRTFKKMVGKAFRPHRLLSQIDKATFIAELQSGTATIAELTTRYGVHRDTINRKFKQITGKSLHPRKLLSQRDKEAIVQELHSGKMTNELADKYDISSGRISQIFQEETGQLLRSYKAVKMPSRYRAWHKQERRMYDVWGIDWFQKKILIQVDGSEAWQSISTFILMRSSGLRDKKRTLEYPEGQEIYAGDIVQFPINLNEKKTEIRDVVAFDQEKGMVIVACTDFGDPLCMYNDECEVIGMIQENPELLGSNLQQIRALLKKYRLA